jgi:hypothetical protein
VGFPAHGLIFVAIGFVLVRFSRLLIELFNWTRYPRLYKWFAWGWFGFSIFWTLTSFAGTYGSYLALRSFYVDGEGQVVEGPVENYALLSRQGRESFTVDGQKFSYSDYNVTPGFNNSRALGGPIDAGVHVRITHVNGEIVRLEVELSAVERAAAGSVESKRSFLPSTDQIEPIPEDSLFAIWGRYIWAAIPVILLGYAARWRWRGRAHIARDPSLRPGYNRMMRGLFLWGSAPVFVGVIVSSFGTVDLSGVFGTSRPVLLSWLLAYIVLGLAIAKWIYWTFYQNGVQKLQQHPGFLDNDRAAKFWPIGGAAIYIITILQSLNL